LRVDILRRISVREKGLFGKYLCYEVGYCSDALEVNYFWWFLLLLGFLYYRAYEKCLVRLLGPGSGSFK
jgi:hypothetical protein